MTTSGYIRVPNPEPPNLTHILTAVQALPCHNCALLINVGDAMLLDEYGWRHATCSTEAQS